MLDELSTVGAAVSENLGFSDWGKKKEKKKKKKEKDGEERRGAEEGIEGMEEDKRKEKDGRIWLWRQ